MPRIELEFYPYQGYVLPLNYKAICGDVWTRTTDQRVNCQIQTTAVGYAHEVTLEYYAALPTELHHHNKGTFFVLAIDFKSVKISIAVSTH